MCCAGQCCQSHCWITKGEGKQDTFIYTLRTNPTAAAVDFCGTDTQSNFTLHSYLLMQLLRVAPPSQVQACSWCHSENLPSKGLCPAFGTVLTLWIPLLSQGRRWETVLSHTLMTNATTTACGCCETEVLRNYLSHNCLPIVHSLTVTSSFPVAVLQCSCHWPHLKILLAAWVPANPSYHNQHLNTLARGLRIS